MTHPNELPDMALVSVIMAAYNADKYIEEAILSVINQTHENWELLIVNDGSKDTTEEKILQFEDSRIKYFYQENNGVSAARNVGLKNMTGDYFCFLDADDVYPPQSIESRLKVFETTDEIEFVDGTIHIKDSKLTQLLEVRNHNFIGNPFRNLVRLDSNCFFGPSWLIKIKDSKKYLLTEGMTHAEDLYFYITISSDGIYASTEEVVLFYRKNDSSAMSDLKGLENGYAKLHSHLSNLDHVRKDDLNYLKWRIIRIMFLSYLKKKQFLNAFKVVLRYIIT